MIEKIAIGSRIPLVGDPDLQAVGEAFHRFFACDDQTATTQKRHEIARSMLARWGAPEVAPADLVMAADRLHGFVEQRFGQAPRMLEWPIHALDDGRVIVGRIDMLIDHRDAFAIIDHKSFPGAMELDEGRLGAFGGQVELYSRALRCASGRGCEEYWVHQPIAGLMLRVGLTA